MKRSSHRAVIQRRASRGEMRPIDIAVVMGLLAVAAGVVWWVRRPATNTATTPESTQPASSETTTPTTNATEPPSAARSDVTRDSQTQTALPTPTNAGNGATTANTTGTASDASTSDGSARATRCSRRFRHCSTDLGTDCETDIENDVANCGVCGFDCRGLPNITPGLAQCVNGRCNLASACAAPFADCEFGGLDGCEANLQTSARHCGACNHACAAAANATGACAAGRCTLSCVSGFFDCDHEAGNGCESATACN